VSQRIARNTIGTCLQNDEIGRVRFEMTQHLLPGGLEHGIVGTRHERQIEFGARRLPLADLILGARARVQVPPILVDIGEDQSGVRLEAVIKPIAVMGVDIDVGNTLQTVFAAQPFDEHATVVQGAKARSAPTSRMVQPGNRHEGATRPTPHDLLARQQNASHDV